MTGKRRLVTLRTTVRGLPREAAVVAAQHSAAEMEFQRDAAMRTRQHLTAQTALEVVGITSTIEEQQTLLANLMVGDQGLTQGRRKNPVPTAGSRLLAQINDF